MKFELPEFQYEMDALEPYISKKTLEFHHGKFHQEYIINLNSLISGTKFKKQISKPLLKLLKALFLTMPRRHGIMLFILKV